MTNSGIYKILNLVTGKFYIGSAINLEKRWLKHKRYANGKYHHSIIFQRAWDLYGENAFTFEVLEYCEKEKLLEREQHWLDVTKCYNPDIGYNINKIANSPMGLKRSDEAKERMRQAQLGSSHTQEHKDNIGIAHRDLKKWPCFNGSKCKCKRCNKIKNENVIRLRKLKAEKEGRTIFNRIRIQD